MATLVVAARAGQPPGLGTGRDKPGPIQFRHGARVMRHHACPSVFNKLIRKSIFGTMLRTTATRSAHRISNLAMPRVVRNQLCAPQVRHARPGRYVDGYGLMLYVKRSGARSSNLVQRLRREQILSPP